MRVLCFLLISALLDSGCATGLGCLAGAGTGGLIGGLSAASSQSQNPGVNINAGSYIGKGIMLGLVCGCIAAEVARVRENSIRESERTRKELEELRAAQLRAASKPDVSAVIDNNKAAATPPAPPPPPTSEAPAPHYVGPYP